MNKANLTRRSTNAAWLGVVLLGIYAISLMAADVWTCRCTWMLTGSTSRSVACPTIACNTDCEVTIAAGGTPTCYNCPTTGEPLKVCQLLNYTVYQGDTYYGTCDRRPITCMCYDLIWGNSASFVCWNATGDNCAAVFCY